MIRAQIYFKGPEDAEPELGLPFDLPAPPQVGDRIQIARKGEHGSIDGIVISAFWHLISDEDRSSYTDDDVRPGRLGSFQVICEAIISPFSSEEHRKTFPGARHVAP